jgi:hypothetical protein
MVIGWGFYPNWICVIGYFGCDGAHGYLLAIVWRHASMFGLW